MNELITTQKQLPNTAEQLVDYVVINEEKLNAVNAAIRAAKKAGSINLEELERQRRELEVTTVLAQCKLGELTKEMEKAPANQYTSASADARQKQKALQDIGISHQRASEYERMASHPEIVQRVIDNEERVTKSAILKEIKKPHIVNNSGDNEWYTPAEYIESAREVMGSIDLDPASNDYANQTVKAGEYYTEDDDGLAHEWFGNIWMNPPYSAKLIKPFIDKLIASNFEQAVVLVNNATDTAWFRQLTERASAIVFTTGRIRFQKFDGAVGAPLQGQAFIYCGSNTDKFMDVFSKYGWGARL